MKTTWILFLVPIMKTTWILFSGGSEKGGKTLIALCELMKLIIDIYMGHELG